MEIDSVDDVASTQGSLPTPKTSSPPTSSMEPLSLSLSCSHATRSSPPLSPIWSPSFESAIDEFRPSPLPSPHAFLTPLPIITPRFSPPAPSHAKEKKRPPNDGHMQRTS